MGRSLDEMGWSIWGGTGDLQQFTMAINHYPDQAPLPKTAQTADGIAHYDYNRNPNTVPFQCTNEVHKEQLHF